MQRAVSGFNDVQLDALREVANIGSGNAGTALGAMLGRSVDITVPRAAAMPLAEAVASAGPPEDMRHGVCVPILGDMDAIVVLLFPEPDACTLCAMYDLEPSTADGRSMLAEVGNILGTSYVNVLAQMLGMNLEPAPPQVVEDMLGAIVESVLLAWDASADTALILDSSLMVEEEECSLSFLLFPAEGGVRRLLERLGV